VLLGWQVRLPGLPLRPLTVFVPSIERAVALGAHEEHEGVVRIDERLMEVALIPRVADVWVVLEILFSGDSPGDLLDLVRDLLPPREFRRNQCVFWDRTAVRRTAARQYDLPCRTGLAEPLSQTGAVNMMFAFQPNRRL
jgi:hypothetical protein